MEGIVGRRDEKGGERLPDGNGGREHDGRDVFVASLRLDGWVDIVDAFVDAVQL